MDVSERLVATAHGIDPQTNLACVAADFYLLEALANLKHDDWARHRLDQHERSLARDFSLYLDIAIGGELRHARSRSSLPRQLRPYLDDVSGGDRGGAWLAWSIIRLVHGVEALEWAYEAFDSGSWSRGFGGKPWADATLTLIHYLQDRMPVRMFVDRCFNLEHHNGCILNKVYNVSDLHEVLAAHGIDDYRTLLKAASPEVHHRWRRDELLRLREHDPIWLGVQIMEILDDVA